MSIGVAGTFQSVQHKERGEYQMALEYKADEPNTNELTLSMVHKAKREFAERVSVKIKHPVNPNDVSLMAAVQVVNDVSV